MGTQNNGEKVEKIYYTFPHMSHRATDVSLPTKSILFGLQLVGCVRIYTKYVNIDRALITSFNSLSARFYAIVFPNLEASFLPSLAYGLVIDCSSVM